MDRNTHRVATSPGQHKDLLLPPRAFLSLFLRTPPGIPSEPPGEAFSTSALGSARKTRQNAPPGGVGEQ
eukprot:7052183-Alexandrium_andersonii.AAC.1